MRKLGLIIALCLPFLFAPLAAFAATPIFSATISSSGPTSSFYLPTGGNASVFFQGGTDIIQLEASPDGVTWYPTYAAGSNQLYVWSLTGNNVFDTISNAAGGIYYRFNCTAYTSSTSVAVYR